MLESMTGTAALSFRACGIPFSVWMRSLNHRFFEVVLRCPPVLHSFEGDLEELVRSRFRRGRVEIEVSSGDPGSFRRLHFNRALAQHYLDFCRDLTGDRNPAVRAEAMQVLALPGVVDIRQELPEGFRIEEFEKKFANALDRLKKTRRREGKAIEGILRGYIGSIEAANKDIRKRHGTYRKEKLENLRKELRVSKTTSGNGEGAGDPLKYAVDWIDRHDISEELERIGLHANAVRGLISGKDEEAGKQIEFYSQELLREANTIASKSRDFEIRRLAVEMKTQIENIKEQIRNVC